MEIRDAKEGWEERVAPGDLADANGAHHLARYLFAAHFAAGRSAADLCCGTGYGTNLLLASGATDALGIDLSPEAIDEAKRSFPGPAYVVGDVTEPIELKKADLRVCFEGVEHVANPEALVENLRRDLPHDGVVIISTPNGDQGHSGNPYHVHEFRRAEFQELMSGHFSDVRVYFQWWYPDPLDQSWGLASVARALIPIKLKSLLRRPQSNVRTGSAEGPASAISFRPLPEAELKALPPGLRYGTPGVWIAVCRP